MIYTLIKNKIVVDNIVADQDFIDGHPELYDIALPYKEDEWHPGIGFTHLGGNDFQSVIFDKMNNEVSQKLDDLSQKVDALLNANPDLANKLAQAPEDIKL